MKKILAFCLLIFFSTSQSAYARCRAFLPEEELPQIALIVEATVVEANNDNHELSQCAGENNCLFKASMSIDRILKGNTQKHSFSASYAYWEGCPGVDTFKTGEKRIFFLNADGTLYGKSCGFSGAPLKGDYADTIRKLIQQKRKTHHD